MSRCSIFFFIDAMGAEVVRDQPVIRDLAEHFKPLRSVFGYSSACVPSILTGRFPEEHLHWSYFTYRGPGTGLKIPLWVRLMPPALRDRGRVRSKLSKPVGRLNGITGYFQMYMMPVDELHQYGHCEPKDIFLPGGMNRGDNIFDHLQRNRTPFWVSDWHQTTAQKWAGMEQAARDPGCEFLLMYDGDLDAWLHDNTRDSPALPARLGEVRAKIDRVLAAARGVHDEVLFYVFSDHGMSTTRKYVDPFPYFAKSRLRMHHDYHCVIDSTMVRLWYPSERVRDELRGCLEGLPGLTRLDPAYLKQERCAFPDNRFGDEFYLAEPHMQLVPSHLGKKPLAAMHGYSCDDPDSDATFLTNDPAANPDCIVQLHDLMVGAASAA
jgi:predicted AlkP superfamily pyrophosphatase or phosphodiesterase